MSRFKELFEQVEKENRVARIPFLMLGDPTIEMSLRIIDSVVAGGADALELGIPFSDPIADGPIVQQAATRARKAGVTLQTCFEMLTQIRQKYPTLPIGLLVYANLVFYQGIGHFYAQVSKAGVDAVLIPDVPTEESYPFCSRAKENGIAPVLLATAACQDKDLQQLASLCEGFTYVVTRAGVTGIDKQSEFTQASRIVDKLKRYNAPPAVFGFGIRNAKDVNEAYRHQAKGAIIGSALILALSKMTMEDLAFGTKVTALTQQLFLENVN